MKRKSLILYLTLSLLIGACATEEEDEDDVLFATDESMPLVQWGRHLLSVDCLRENRSDILVGDITAGRSAMGRCVVSPPTAGARETMGSRFFHTQSPGTYVGNAQAPWMNFGPEFQESGQSYASLPPPPVSPSYYYPDLRGGQPGLDVAERLPPSIFLSILFAIPTYGGGVSPVSMLYYLLFDIGIPQRVLPTMPYDGYLVPSHGYLIPPGYGQPIDSVDFSMNQRCVNKRSRRNHVGLAAGGWGTLLNSGSAVRNHRSCGKRVKFHVDYR